MAQNFANQPDFTAAAHALHTAGNAAHALHAAGDELAKYPNLPAIQGGNAILTAIQDMERRIQTQLQALSTQLQAVSTQQQALSTQFQNLTTHQQAS